MAPSPVLQVKSPVYKGHARVETEDIVFCGFHSMQNVFLNGHFIQIKISVYIHTPHIHIHALFSVLNRNLIQSYKTAHPMTAISIRSHRIIKTTNNAYSYHVVVNKFYHVILKNLVQCRKYTVHNGPGPMATKVPCDVPNNVVCSTFQCYITLFSYSQENQTFTYFSSQLKMHLKYKVNEN